MADYGRETRGWLWAHLIADDNNTSFKAVRLCSKSTENVRWSVVGRWLVAGQTASPQPRTKQASDRYRSYRYRVSSGEDWLRSNTNAVVRLLQ